MLGPIFSIFIPGHLGLSKQQELIFVGWMIPTHPCSLFLTFLSSKINLTLLRLENKPISQLGLIGCSNVTEFWPMRQSTELLGGRQGSPEEQTA